VIPTTAGSVVTTCTAAPGADSNLLATCERAASTLRLHSARSVPLATVVAAEQRWRLSAGRLRVDRAAGRRKLSQARRQAGQIQAAEALARVHERAAARFAKLTGGALVAEAARRTADAYGALAGAAANNSTRSWAAAAGAVRRAEARLAKALAAG
jgi:hypothetical protein